MAQARGNLRSESCALCCSAWSECALECCESLEPAWLPRATIWQPGSGTRLHDVRNCFSVRVFGQENRWNRYARVGKLRCKLDGLRVSGFLLQQDKTVGFLLEPDTCFLERSRLLVACAAGLRCTISRSRKRSSSRSSTNTIRDGRCATAGFAAGIMQPSPNWLPSESMEGSLVRWSWATTLTIVNSSLTISYLLRLTVQRFSFPRGFLEHLDRVVRIAQ